jgi:pimeloyl-ACP methyl ester carboxylesterase
MQFFESGQNHTNTILLLHGGGLSWWNYREAAALLGEAYHVILPILDGHAGSDRPFTTIEDNAAEILSFLDERCSGAAKLIGGLSLGGQILLEMLSQRKDVCAYALVESAAVLPARLTNALIAPAFGSSYGLIRNRHFAKLQFQSLHIKPELFEDYYRDTCRKYQSSDDCRDGYRQSETVCGRTYVRKNELFRRKNDKRYDVQQFELRFAGA